MKRRLLAREGLAEWGPRRE